MILTLHQLHQMLEIEQLNIESVFCPFPCIMSDALKSTRLIF